MTNEEREEKLKKRLERREERKSAREERRTEAIARREELGEDHFWKIGFFVFILPFILVCIGIGTFLVWLVVAGTSPPWVITLTIVTYGIAALLILLFRWMRRQRHALVARRPSAITSPVTPSQTLSRFLCPFCEDEISTDAVFCAHCGTRL